MSPPVGLTRAALRFIYAALSCHGGVEVALKHAAISALLVTINVGDLQGEQKNRKIVTFPRPIKLSPHDLQCPHSISFNPK